MLDRTEFARWDAMNAYRNAGMTCLLILLVSLCVPACKKAAQPSQVNVIPGNIALKGYDAVAYFTDMRPVKGSPEFEYTWQGVRWRFSGAPHLDMFRAEPEKYAPRYGGYCAYAVSQGKIADIDPEAWTIYEGKLYLNLNKDVQKLWEKDKPDFIRKADENWPGALSR